MFTSALRHSEKEAGGIDLLMVDAPAFRLIRARVEGAGELGPVEFQQRTRAAYGAIARRLESSPRRFPVRFWNYIPSIHQPSGEGLDRYMMFNAARFEACRQWLGSSGAGGEGFERHLPTASGIGHSGRDLIIDALATAAPGVAIENPRQIPSYRYTRRYGPRPPCFARATQIADLGGGRSLVLVGGTASIVGEESRHLGDLSKQIQETLLNLASVVRAAAGNLSPSDDLAELKRFKEVRVYYPRPADARKIGSTLRPYFSRTARLEMGTAELCRKELLVEIEGIAVIEKG